MMTDKELEQGYSGTNLDEAVRAFKAYCEGHGSFDELDFKGWLIDVWLAERFRERSRIKNGWNANGTTG